MYTRGRLQRWFILSNEMKTQLTISQLYSKCDTSITVLSSKWTDVLHTWPLYRVIALIITHNPITRWYKSIHIMVLHTIHDRWTRRIEDALFARFLHFISLTQNITSMPTWFRMTCEIVIPRGNPVKCPLPTQVARPCTPVKQTIWTKRRGCVEQKEPTSQHIWMNPCVSSSHSLLLKCVGLPDMEHKAAV